MNLDLPTDCLVVFVDETGDELLKDPVQKVFGLAGCAIMAGDLDRVVRTPWLEVLRVVAGSPIAQLHATDLRNPTSTQIETISSYFRTQSFSRFGSICSVQTELDKDITPLVLVARCLGNRLVDILKWQPFASVEIVFEHSERLAPQIEEVFGSFSLSENGKEIPTGFSWLQKSMAEPALEVADFLANSVGTEARHRISQKSGHAKNFEAFFHHADQRLVSFMDIRKVEVSRVT